MAEKTGGICGMSVTLSQRKRATFHVIW